MIALCAATLVGLPALARATTTTPTDLRISNSSQGFYLTWSSGTATGFTLTEATDSGFTQSRVDWDVRADFHQFTPYGLTKGTTYYFEVRALNGSSASPYSSVVSGQVASSEQYLRVMSYNVTEATADGTVESGNVISTWYPYRQNGAVALIKASAPDVIGIQEAAAWMGAVKGPRQIDYLRTALGSSYSLAKTEITPGQPNWERTGCYILYNNQVYETVGAGNHWVLPYSRWAAYQVLRNRSTGATFLFVSTHFATGSGGTADGYRETEMSSLMSQARSYAASHGNVPIVYAGDFNSDVNSNHAFDGPGVAATAAGVDDAFYAARYTRNQNYNSANLYMRTPPAMGDSIDKIYAPAGVSARSWTLSLNLVNGSFVGTIPSDHNPLVSDMAIPY